MYSTNCFTYSSFIVDKHQVIELEHGLHAGRFYEAVKNVLIEIIVAFCMELFDSRLDPSFSTIVYSHHESFAGTPFSHRALGSRLVDDKIVIDDKP